MDTSRNDLLGEIAADAELERADFLASASSQLSRFLDANESRIREMGGLVLIDDEADYLAIAEDMSFRSRTRYLDEATGKWTSNIEVIESVAELAELYNPADIFAAFGEATRLEAGAETAAAGGGVPETTGPLAAATRSRPRPRTRPPSVSMTWPLPSRRRASRPRRSCSSGSSRPRPIWPACWASSSSSTTTTSG
jgi:hypothetical protein